MNSIVRPTNKKNVLRKRTMITLKEIADAIDEQWDDEQSAFYDRETRGIVCMDSTTCSEYESANLEDLSDWQQEGAKLYKLIQEDDEKSWDDENYQCRFLQLPSKFDVHEYRLMELFSAGQGENVAGELLRAIRGKGAFRYFRDTIERLGLRDEWFEYRQEHLLEMAREFCEANGIEFKE